MINFYHLILLQNHPFRYFKLNFIYLGHRNTPNHFLFFMNYFIHLQIFHFHHLILLLEMYLYFHRFST